MKAQNSLVGLQQTWATNKGKTLVPLSEFRAYIPRNGIPPLSRTSFLNQRQAVGKYEPKEPMLVIIANSIEKAYPMSVLMHHLVVNDRVGKVSVALTFCPVTGSVAVYDRSVSWEGFTDLLNVGSAGMLRHGNTVLWDTKTESWWQQLSGEALTGQYAGAKLALVPFSILSYEQFFQYYPYGLVMNPDPAEEPLYGVNIYPEYDSPNRDKPFIVPYTPDPRLPAMEKVTRLTALQQTVLYPWSTVKSLGVINDAPNDVYVALFYESGVRSYQDQKLIKESKDGGTVLAYSAFVNNQRLTFRREGTQFVDNETGSVWDLSGKCLSGKLKGEQLKLLESGIHFAFAALAIYPQACIFGQGN